MEAPDEYSEAASALPSMQSFAQLEASGETHLAQKLHGLRSDLARRRGR
jgi:hypothetical protein